MKKTIVALTFALFGFTTMGTVTAKTTVKTDSQQQDTVRTYNLEETTIWAEKLDIASTTLHVVNNITRDQILACPVQNINELLEYLPNVDVRTRSAFGVQADISMRGGTYDQVVVLLNGVNVTDPQTGHYTLDLPIDLNMVDRIEVLQGNDISVFGLSAFSGAINIVTGSTDKREAKVGIVAGDYGFLAPKASVNYASGGWHFVGSASHNRSNGYIDNTDYRFTNVFMQAACNDESTGEWNIQVGGQVKDYGANGFYALAYPKQYEKVNTLIASLRWNKRVHDFGLTASAFYRRHYDQFQLFRDKKDAASWYTNHNHHITDVVGGNFTGSWYNRLGKTSIGVELRNDKIVSNVLGEPLETPRNLPWYVTEDDIQFTLGKERLNLDSFIEQFIYAGRFTTSVGGSINTNSMTGTNLAAGLNIGYKMANVIIHGNVSRSLRLPTYTDLYYHSATQISNPDLKPESAILMELGSDWTKNGFRAHLSAYTRLSKNTIDWVKTPEETKWRSVNHESVNAFGGDITLGYASKGFVRNASVSYTICHMNYDVGESLMSKYALDYLKNKLVFGLTHSIWKGFGADWKLMYHQRNGTYADREGKIRQYQPFWVLDGRLFWQHKGLMLYAEASNITASNYYDYGGIEQPGLWAKAGIELTFGL